MQNNRVFCNFVKSRLQNHHFFTTFLVSPTKSSTFVSALEICKFFSIAFVIYGVKLLLTHLAVIARWVFFFYNIFAYIQKKQYLCTGFGFSYFVKCHPSRSDCAVGVFILREKFPIK